MLKLSFFTGGIAQTNGWLLETDSGAVAFDAPAGLAAWLRQREVQLNALVLTHQHFDHVQDAAAVKAEQGCSIYSFAPYDTDLTLENLFAAVSGMRIDVPPYVVDHVLEGQTSVTIGGFDFSLLHVPGHSPDSLCFYHRPHHLLFGGDVLFAGGIGRTDFPGGSTALLLRGIAEKLLGLPDDTRVLPGHGPETTIGEERLSNPFLEG